MFISISAVVAASVIYLIARKSLYENLVYLAEGI